MTIRDEILELQKKHGILQPETVINWARDNPDSSLYAAIDWNDQSAAHSHRLWQVRQLIAVHVVSKEGVRQMVSLSIDRTMQGGGYRLVGDVLAEPKLADIMLEDALAELKRVQLKYEGLVALRRVWDETHKVAERQAVRKVSSRKRGRREDRPAAR